MDKVINKAIEGYATTLEIKPEYLTKLEYKAVRTGIIWGIAEFLYQICNGFQNWVQTPDETDTVKHKHPKFKGGKEYERRTRR